VKSYFKRVSAFVLQKSELSETFYTTSDHFEFLSFFSSKAIMSSPYLCSGTSLFVILTGKD
jgi:hypothetical protein